MRKTPPILLLLCTLVIAGTASAAGAPNGANGQATVTPGLKCGDQGEQTFARALTGESLIRAAMLRPDEPIDSPWPAPDPRDTGLEAFARCRIWDGGILGAVSGTRT